MASRRSIAVLAVTGIIAGAGGGAAVRHVVPGGAAAPPQRAAAMPGDGRFVTLGALLLPLRLPAGGLAGYVRVEAQLEVGEDEVETVTARLPHVIHAVNLRAYAAPLAGGADGRLPDAALISRIVAEEAGKTLGRGVVRSVALTSLTPA